MRRIERGSYWPPKPPQTREINSIDDFHHSFISTGLIPSQVPPTNRNTPQGVKRKDLMQMRPGVAEGLIPLNRLQKVQSLLISKNKDSVIPVIGDQSPEMEETSVPNPATHTPTKDYSPLKMPSRVRRCDLRGKYRRSDLERGLVGPSPHVGDNWATPSPVHSSSNVPFPLSSYLREPAIRFVKGNALDMSKEAKVLDEKQQKSASPNECCVSSDEEESGGVPLHSYSPIRASISHPDPDPGPGSDLVSGFASVNLGSSKSNKTASGIEKFEKDTRGSGANGNPEVGFVSYQRVSVFEENKNIGFYSRDAGDYAAGNTAQMTHTRAAKTTSRTEFFQGGDSLKLSKEFSSTVREKYAPSSVFGVDNIGGYAEFNGLPEDFSLSVDSPAKLRSPSNAQTLYRRVRAYREGDIITGTDKSMLSETSMGFRAMERLGFEKGKGLGRNSDGIAEAIPITIKVGRSGLGYSQGSPSQSEFWGNDSFGNEMLDNATSESRSNLSLVPYNPEEDPLVNPETLYSVDSYLARNLTRDKLTLLLRNYCNDNNPLSENHVREVFRACMQHMDKVSGRKFSATQVEAIFRHKFRKVISTLDRVNDDVWSLDGFNDPARDQDLELEGTEPSRSNGGLDPRKKLAGTIAVEKARNGNNYARRG
ncbi:hypothetical protein L873DRAFT_1787621 [Choiromyces venosus 120613-1]|uniref:G-patch domain-containing protein n=1 Tax=Choiromyces venosus 120613-1 TaxID=1336337 RepID=A0A3N4K9K0_9PEZI|nr:hypothetical protein L873DRAFT_1787621 [Choiromyces venosus 120613-1]